MELTKAQKIQTIALLGQSSNLSHKIPAGWNIVVVLFHNTTVNQAILDGGSTPGGNEFFFNAVVDGSAVNGGWSTQSGQFTPDISAIWTLYISGAWNAAICDVYIIIQNIF
jgi:hypothetical protein